MRKLKLDLEAIDVDSFDTTALGDDRRGTAQAHQCHQTCDFTCGGTFNPEHTCQGIGHCDNTETRVLSGPCCYSQECTGDPNDFQCINSYNFCYETQQNSCELNC